MSWKSQSRRCVSTGNAMLLKQTDQRHTPPLHTTPHPLPLENVTFHRIVQVGNSVVWSTVTVTATPVSEQRPATSADAGL